MPEHIITGGHTRRPLRGHACWRQRITAAARTLAWGALAGLVLASAALAPHAHAETPGQQFNVCYALRHGANLVDIETRLVAGGYSETAAGALTGRMLRDHCPDQIEMALKQVGI